MIVQPPNQWFDPSILDLLKNRGTYVFFLVEDNGQRHINLL